MYKAYIKQQFNPISPHMREIYLLLLNILLINIFDMLRRAYLYIDFSQLYIL